MKLIHSVVWVGQGGGGQKVVEPSLYIRKHFLNGVFENF